MDRKKISRAFSPSNRNFIKSQIVIILKKKICLHLGKILSDKQYPKQRKAFKEKINEYLKIAKETPEALQVWFWDECRFSLRVIRRRCWTKKGQRKKVTGQRIRGRVNIMGGLRYNDKKRICFVIKKGDSETFYEQIQKLNKFVKMGIQRKRAR